MSTTFGIRINETDAPIEVARRSSGGMYWINELAKLLPDTQPVEALDNSSQGIHTIGDIRNAIQEMEDRNPDEPLY